MFRVSPLDLGMNRGEPIGHLNRFRKREKVLTCFVAGVLLLVAGIACGRLTRGGASVRGDGSRFGDGVNHF